MLAERIAHYLLARQRRKAIHDLYENAAEAGLLQGDFIRPGDEDSGLVWRLAPHRLTGDIEAEHEVIRRALRGRRRQVAHPDQEHDAVHYENVRSVPKGLVAREMHAAAARRSAVRSVGIDGCIDRTGMLRQIRERLPSPLVAEAAVALLVARAVSESEVSAEALFGLLDLPNPVIIVRAPVAGFESRFGRMLASGLIVSGRIAFADGVGQVAFNNTCRTRPGALRIATLSGKSARERGDDVTRNALAKACSERVPIVVVDEVRERLPPRIQAGADLVLTCSGLDPSLIAELMQLCAGIAPGAALAAMSAVTLDCTALAIDDLVLAIRPGRSATEIVNALVALEKDNRDSRKEDESEWQSRDGGKRRSDFMSAGSRRESSLPQFEIIQPVGSSTSSLASDIKRPHQQHAPLVETLAGYGDAKTWALDLKHDLTMWRQGDLGWPEMSTRLLLSGPPGTGKTTFAQALCNTLQVPLLATSLGQWLEAAYLGDVLKLMSSAFETAQRHAPAILFLDEIDNIGRRGGDGDRYGNYWDTLVNRMLELLDGASRTEGVIVVGATNQPEKIDPALLRSGRLERHVRIAKPDTEALAAILAYHLGDDLEGVLATCHALGVNETEIARVIASQTDPLSASPTDRNLEDRP